MKISLRDYQQEAFDQAREAVRQGAKSVLIVSPTGSGKTVIASALLEMALAKGRRSNFVVDRLSILGQTSDTFDRYGLDHGVVQGMHPRYRPSMPIQVCSVQTVAKRGWPLDADLDVFDEAHVLHKAHKARISQRRVGIGGVQIGGVVIGLTATPFTRGLAQWFDAVVNVTTTRKLIEDGWLSPYRVFSCAEPNMAGVAVKSTGEWEEAGASKAALEVVGDVVAEYLKHGDGRKFICSAVDTAHVEELQRQFVAAGINAATYTYKDAEEDRSDTVAEFRKPDSSIRGLITVTAASRGFDVADVGCIIMARPLRKSLAEHIQLFGRGLRISPETGKKDCLVLCHCIATGQRVLTHRGLVRIEEILLTDKLWDGHEFVTHKGVVSRGIRPVIRYAGLAATADHPVKTAQGWRTLGQCADEQAPVITTGVGRTALRERDGYFTGPGVAWPAGKALRACAVRVRHLRLSVCDFLAELAAWSHKGLRRLQSAGANSPEVAICASAGDEAALLEPEGPAVHGLRRERDRVPFRLSDHLRSMDQGELDAAFGPGVVRVGSHQQRWPLRAWESSLGDAASKLEQHADKQVGPADAQVQTCSPRRPLRRRVAEKFSGLWNVLQGHRGQVGDAVSEAEGEVWDILDCGPRNSFTCEGLLVHNSGNMARFWQETEEFFDFGIEGLDDGKAKKKKEEKKKEAEAVKCPQCRALHKPAPFCPQCGHEYPKRQTVQHVPGTLKELIATGDQAMLRRELWPQVVWHALQSTDDMDRAQRKAQAIYRELTGDFARARVESTTPVVASREVLNKIKANTIRWAKSRRAAERAAA